MFLRGKQNAFVSACVWMSERVGFGEEGGARGGEVRKAFIVVQMGNSELFRCGIERVVFLTLQECY